MTTLHAILASLGSIGAEANARSALEQRVCEDRAVDELESRIAPASPSVTGAAASAA